MMAVHLACLLSTPLPITKLGPRKLSIKPVVRPATADDIARFYKGTYNLTTTAMVGTVRGHIGACWGISHVRGRLVMFCDIKPWARRYKLTIARQAKAFMDQAKDGGARYIWTEADPDEPGAMRWIESLGFKPTNTPRVFRWHRE